MAFYSAVTGADLELDNSGPNPMANLTPEGHECGRGRAPLPRQAGGER